MIKTIDSLTEYSRGKVIAQARAWRLKHHALVLELIKGCQPPAPPAGATMFDPAKWDGCNWLWFQTELVKRLTRGTRND